MSSQSVRRKQPGVIYWSAAYTLPEYHGRGIATALPRYIVDYVKATPAKSVSLHASEISRSIYERCGFVASGGAMTLNV